MVYHFRIHKDKGGLWAECIELRGCLTQADTMDELFYNMSEALNLYLDEPDESLLNFPPPKKNVKGKNIVEIAVIPRIAFALQLRSIRLKKKYTQKKTAELLKMKNLYSYQRLECPQKANPSLSTISRIKEIFPEFDVNSAVEVCIRK